MVRNALAQRWEFEVPSINNLLQPIQGGIDRYNRQAQQGEENRRADEQLGMQRERLGMDRTRFSDERQQRAKQAAGNLALLTLQESDPNRRAEKWRSFLSTHPNAAGLDQRYHDPAVGPMAVLADAGMAQTYLDYQMKRAAEARAAESLNLQRNQDSRAAATHSAQMAQYQNMSPAQRQQAASTLGLQPGTPAFNTFLSTGQYTPPGDPLRSVKDGETLLRVPTAPGSQAEVVWAGQSNRADGKFAEKTAEAQAKQYSDAVAELPAVRTNLGKIDIMKQLSGAIGQPGIVNTIANSSIGAAARAVGLAPEQMASIESWTAMINQMVPAQRPPGSGTMSDRDVELFKSSLPMLAATKEGRDFILAQMEGIARYDERRALIANEAINGRLTRQQANDRLMSLPNPLADVSNNMQRFGIRAPKTQGAPQGGGGQRYVNPQTGEIVEWNGRAYVRVGGAAPSLPTVDANGIPYPPASR